MDRSKTLKKYLKLSLAGAALCASLGAAAGQQGQGQGASKEPGQIPGQTVITDVNGVTHVHQARISDSARKEVAKRQKAALAKKAAQKQGGK